MKKNTVLLLVILVLVAVQLLLVITNEQKFDRFGTDFQLTSESCFTLQLADAWEKQSDSGLHMFLMNPNFDMQIAASVLPISKFEKAGSAWQFLEQYMNYSLAESEAFQAEDNYDSYFEFYAIRKAPTATAEDVYGDANMGVIIRLYRDYVATFELITDGKAIPDNSLTSEFAYVARNLVASCKS